MQDNVVDIDDHRRPDPILRVGDVVRLVKMDRYIEWEKELQEQTDYDVAVAGAEAYEGKLGTVTRICMIRPLSDRDAPGQAAYVDVRVIHPGLSDGEEFLDAISTDHLRRVYSRTAEIDDLAIQVENIRLKS